MTDLLHIRTFVTVAEECHLTRAAESLHMSPSTASTHIRALEDRLGTQLFNRKNHQLELTRAGQLLLPRARGLLHQSAEFNAFARELGGKVEGALVVSLLADPANTGIGEILKELRERSPLISIDLRSKHSTAAMQGVKTGEIDIALVTSLPLGADFACYPLRTLRFRIVGPAAWRHRIQTADWNELALLPWVMPNEQGLLASIWLDRQFADRGLAFTTVVRFDNSPLARVLVKAGVGMTLLREEYALQGEREGTLALSPLPTADLSLVAVHLSSRMDDPLVRAFMEAVTSVYPNAVRQPGDNAQPTKSTP